MKLTLLAFLSIAFIFSGCKKEEGNSPCSLELSLTATSTTPTVGESFSITASPENQNDIFSWSGPGNLSSVHGATITISSATYANRGWYYSTKSNVGCNPVFDSIFIDVRLRQAVPPCTPADNSLTGSAIPTTDFQSVSKYMDPTFNGIVLMGDASIGYPGDFRILFNSYNGNTEPLDGVYTTKNTLAFGMTDPYDLVSIGFIYNSQYFQSHAGKDVFVSHVNGKLSATFCAVPFSNGTNIVTLSGKLTEN